jgi:hypothetical protein
MWNDRDAPKAPRRQQDLNAVVERSCKFSAGLPGGKSSNSREVLPFANQDIGPFD